MDNSVWIIAAIGGLAINLLNLLEIPKLPADRRPNLKDPWFWAAFPIGALLGGFVGYLYAASGFEIKPVLAAQIGISAPLILKAMAAAVPSGIKLPDGA